MTEKNKLTPAKVFADFKRAYEYKRKWLDSAQEDFEFRLGKQWRDEDKSDLEEQGKPALTINKIHPIINLIAGIESQNRTDLRAFPEGAEDSIVADVATALLKNTVKTSGTGYKVSQQFEDALICGEGYLEPYLDFTYDLLNGEMKFKKLDYNQIYPEPGFKEYDLSDAAYVCKVTFDLSRDQLLSLFPEKEKEIDGVADGKINLDIVGGDKGAGGATLQRQGYPKDERGTEDAGEAAEWTGDLLEYYYKKYVPVYFILDTKLGTVKQTKDKAEADAYAEAANAQEAGGEPTVHVKKRMVPEIWIKAFVGNSDAELDDRPAWSFPSWKGYPFIPNFCYWFPTPIKNADRDLTVQGLVRQLKDPQFEHNKRRSQELHLLNTSANSGWIYEEESLVNDKELKDWGSSPGVHVVYKHGKTPPTRITPTQLSQGHAQLAAEHAQDMKEISGINADLMAMQDGGQASGRAIALRQRQGLVMVQKIFDNLAQTKWILGKFILSQLGAIYDIDKAVRVLGEAFIQENFSRPKMMPVVDPRTGQPAMGPGGQPVAQPVIDPATGQPQMEVDQQQVVITLNRVLNDASLGKFDVAVGESAMNETVRYGNYMTLLEMAQKGIPIPPDVLVEESQLSQGSKEKIKASIERQTAMSAAAPAK